MPALASAERPSPLRPSPCPSTAVQDSRRRISAQCPYPLRRFPEVMFGDRRLAAKRLSVNAGWTFWTKVALRVDEITSTSARPARALRLERTGSRRSSHTLLLLLPRVPRVPATNSGARSAAGALPAGPANAVGGQRVRRTHRRVDSYTRV